MALYIIENSVVIGLAPDRYSLYVIVFTNSMYLNDQLLKVTRDKREPGIF
jgi:hypothetical protein